MTTATAQGASAFELAKLARSRMGQAPPCKSFRDLATFSDFKEAMHSFHLAESQEDIDTTTEQLRPARDAISELTSFTKQAITNLVSCIKSYEGKKDNSAKISLSKKRKQHVPPLGKAIDLVEHGTVVGTAIEVVGMNDIHNKITPEAPIVFRMEKKSPAGLFTATSAATKHLDAFVPKFGKGRDAAVRAAEQKGGDQAEVARAAARYRAQKPLPTDASKELTDLVATLLPPKLMRVPEHKLPVEIATPTTFGISKGYEGVGNETGWQGCMRFSSTGSRLVICTPVQALASVELAGDSKDVDGLRGAFQSMTSKQIDEIFCNSCPKWNLWHATIGPNDALLVPPGFIIYEHALDDCFGVRCCLLLTQHKGLIGEIAHCLTECFADNWEIGAKLTAAIDDTVKENDETEAAATAAATAIADAEQQANENEKEQEQRRALLDEQKNEAEFAKTPPGVALEPVGAET